jgi:MFS family permease
MCTDTRQGIAYLSAPLDFALLLGVPRFRRLATPVGFLVMCLALALSSFSTTTTHLILSQGVGYGLGAGLAYSPVILWMGEWFVKRRGLAFGTMWVSVIHEFRLHDHRLTY